MLLQVEECSWGSAAQLHHHSHPVLSVASLQLDAASLPASQPDLSTLDSRACASSMTLAFSGATDGGVAVWDLTQLSEGYQPSSSPLPSLQPVRVLPGLHQSGVNAMSVARDRSKAGRMVQVTGGDDQAIHVTRLQARSVPGPKLQLHGQ